jgi:hypothetical protein
MNLELIHRELDSTDALVLIEQMVNSKIKYHENKISSHGNEEDFKTRESKIKQLQKDLFDLRKKINLKENNPEVEA